MSLTYSLKYTPKQTNTEVSFICSDNKVHIRFDNFNKEAVISGFEKKLTYLLTYLINYSYLPKVIGIERENALTEVFLKTSDIQDINTAIRTYYNLDKFKGIKVSKNYKKNDCKTFGLLDENCFPLTYDEGILLAGNLESFLSTFKISLTDYLFNDAYSIIIHEENVKDINKKFTEKQIRKTLKAQQNNTFVELW